MAKTPSTVFQLTLKPTKQQEKELLKLQNMGRQIYNACLGESLKRLKKVKRDSTYQEILKLDKVKQKKERTEAFKTLNENHGFTKASIQQYAVKCKNESKFLDQLGVHVIQKIAVRAFEAVQKIALGKAKKVKFKPVGEYITLEGKDNKTYLRFNNGYAIIGKQNEAMYIKFKYRKNDPYYDYAMKHRIKFCKLVTRKHGKKFKFFFQLTFEGTPLQKIKLGVHQTGLDIGPSTIAIVNKDQAILTKFCEEIVSDDKKIKQKQRKASRKLRLLNPQNYDEKGAVRKGKKEWVKSKKYLKLQEEIANHQRCLAARRKQLHGEMVNQIVKESYHVTTEKLSYRAFQKLWGKSVGRSAPSMFIKLLERRLKELGGTLQEIDTFKTKLSQTCLCGKVKKKSLKERTHQCDCGIHMQRDLFSAYLTIFVDSKNKLDLKSAKLDYPYYLPVLEKCLEELKEKKKQSPQMIVSSFGI